MASGPSRFSPRHTFSEEGNTETTEATIAGKTIVPFLLMMR